MKLTKRRLIKIIREEISLLKEADTNGVLDFHYIADALQYEAGEPEYGPDREQDLQTVSDQIRQYLGPGDVRFTEVMNLIDRNEHLYTDVWDIKELVQDVWEAI